VQTIYRNASGPITAFTADGNLVAWFAPGTHRCNAIHVLSLTGVEVTLPKPDTRNVTCRWSVGDGQVELAIDEKSGGALWTLPQHSQVDLDYVVGAEAAAPRERRFDQIAHTGAGAGLWLGGVAGSGSTLVYAVTTVAYVDQVACLSGGSCQLAIVGGAIHRVVGRRSPVVRGTGPAVAVATAAGLVAYIPALDVGPKGIPLPSRTAAVHVRSASTGARVADVTPPDGLPLAIAMAPHVLALLVQGEEQTSIVWYDPTDGRLLGSVPVPRTTSTHLAVSDQLIVYRVGNELHAIDVAGHQQHVLLTTPVTPIGLCIDGNRILWAENVGGLGRIRSLVVG